MGRGGNRIGGCFGFLVRCISTSNADKIRVDFWRPENFGEEALKLVSEAAVDLDSVGMGNGCAEERGGRRMWEHVRESGHFDRLEKFSH